MDALLPIIIHETPRLQIGALYGIIGGRIDPF